MWLYVGMSSDTASTIASRIEKFGVGGSRVEEWSAIMTAVGNSKLLADDKKLLFGAITARVKAASAEAECDSRLACRRLLTQSHMAFENYLTRDDWAALTAPNQCLEVKVSRLSRRALTIGLFNPTEQSAASVVALLIQAMCTPT